MREEILIDTDKRERLNLLLNLVWEWQKVKRTVGFKGRDELWDGLVVPSVRMLEEVSFSFGWHVVDVGSGAGFPGMVMAILRADLRLTLIEASLRKCTIMEEIKRRVGMDLEVVQGRAEEKRWENRFDAAVAMWFRDSCRASIILRKMVHAGGLIVIISGPGGMGKDLPKGFSGNVLNERHTLISGIVSRET